MVPGVLVERDLPAPMRDGVRLRADVYRPAGARDLPVLLLRSPYDKRVAQTVVYQHPTWYAANGYIVAVQDVRGRYASEGTFQPFTQERMDGADTIAWAARLPGSNGRVGTYGFSYAGSAQLLAAAERPPGLRCLAPVSSPANLYAEWFYKGGVLRHAFVLSWAIRSLAIPDALRRGDEAAAGRLQRHLLGQPLLYWAGQEIRADLPSYVLEWMDHPTQDGFWDAGSVAAEERADTPCLRVSGWYDTFLEGTLRDHALLAQPPAAAPAAVPGQPVWSQRLVVGPWAHLPWRQVVGERDFGAAASASMDVEQLAWFDAWLKDVPATSPEEGSVKLFVMGANRWRAADAWPPSEVHYEHWHLHSRGGANSLGGDGLLSRERPDEEPADVFVYDPTDPVPSAGGSSCCDERLAPMGPLDQTSVEIRNDVLVYTSAPLSRDMEVTGPIDFTLFAATDAPDTDWTAKLVVVDASNRPFNLCDGIVRASLADCSDSSRPREPNRVHAYRIDVGATSNLFRRGERIRLEVSSSSFPAYAPNPNTGGPATLLAWISGRPATQYVFHDRTHPSCVRLPVVD